MPRFPRTGTTMMSFPRFSGVTRQLVLANVAVFFLLLIMPLAAPQAALLAIRSFSLSPALLMRGWVWQLVTFGFIHTGVLHIALNMLTLWFIGSYLESAKGSRWLLETYFLSLMGGGLLASAICFTHIFHCDPATFTAGSDAGIFGLLAAFAVLFGDLEMYMFPLPLAIKARYLVIVYMLIEIAFLLSGGPTLGYFTLLGGAALGFLFSRSAGKRGTGVRLSEGIFSLRNSYYRWKRRRAARKFEVYMRKQNRDVRFDTEGRYIDPDERRDPQDHKWMN